MAALIRISYETREELQYTVDKLGADMRNVRIAKKQEGKYKRAYIEICMPDKKRD